MVDLSKYPRTDEPVIARAKKGHRENLAEVFRANDEPLRTWPWSRRYDDGLDPVPKELENRVPAGMDRRYFLVESCFEEPVLEQIAVDALSDPDIRSMMDQRMAEHQAWTKRHPGELAW